jgi:hypothetical protein
MCGAELNKPQMLLTGGLDEFGHRSVAIKSRNGVAGAWT